MFNYKTALGVLCLLATVWWCSACVKSQSLWQAVWELTRAVWLTLGKVSKLAQAFLLRISRKDLQRNIIILWHSGLCNSSSPVILRSKAVSRICSVTLDVDDSAIAQLRWAAAIDLPSEFLSSKMTSFCLQPETAAGCCCCRVDLFGAGEEWAAGGAKHLGS